MSAGAGPMPRSGRAALEASCEGDGRSEVPLAACPTLDSQAATVVDRWCELDHARGFLPADHGVVETTRPLRALVVESILREPGGVGRDLLHAFAALGRLMAEAGASPTLAASSVDRLVEALPLGPAEGRGHNHEEERACVTLGRAAAIEGYVHTRMATARDEARAGWEYPACAVMLGDDLVAVAAGCPYVDDEELAGWASRVARGAVKAGVRRAVVTGTEEAVLALGDAFDLAGIELLSQLDRVP